MLTKVATTSRFRMSLAGLMLLVGYLAVGLAALRHTSAAWAGVMLLATLGMLGVAILGAITRHGRLRAWWLGFALFGSVYLALGYAPWTRPRLPTTTLLAHVYARFAPPGVPGRSFTITSTGTGLIRVVSDSGWTLEASEITLDGETMKAFGTAGMSVGSTVPGHFLDVGHCLLTCPAAVIGAFAARRFHATRRPAGPDK
jgi:hypothetical protein